MTRASAARVRRRAAAKAAAGGPTITFYDFPGEPLPVRPAEPSRAWMDATPRRAAYRCLPMAVANTHGWELLCRRGFRASWDGGPEPGAVRVEPLGGGGGDAKRLPSGSVGHGVLQFELGCVVRTSPGWDLWMGGPANAPVDGLAPLTGIVEADWWSAGLHMSWLFTRPGAEVEFAAGSPFCLVFPVRRGLLERVAVERRPIADHPEVAARNDALVRARLANIERVRAAGGSAVDPEIFTTSYHKGRHGDGSPGAPDHRVKLRLARPVSR